MIALRSLLSKRSIGNSLLFRQRGKALYHKRAYILNSHTIRFAEFVHFLLNKSVKYVEVALLEGIIY